MDKILVINSGSSSIKYQVVDMPDCEVVATGMIEGVGELQSIFKLESTNRKEMYFVTCHNHVEGLKTILESLRYYSIIEDFSDIVGCGHRVAHGGDIFKESTVIDDEKAALIESLATLAPLHNAINISGYYILKEMIPKSVQVAVFDTSFHQSILEEDFLYPLPYTLYKDHAIRKYGFHGTSHKYVSQRIKDVLDTLSLDCMIVCHLGNGASITAIKDGQSVNTSMGISPLGGLMMGTRCGDLDPTVIEYMVKQLDLELCDVMDILNNKSGLLGVSEVSYDMRKLLKTSNAGDYQSQLAIKMFVRRIVNYIAAYYFQLEKVDMIVFTGGIGENSAQIRNMILEDIKGPLNITLLDNTKQIEDDVQLLTTKNSKCQCAIVKTNEELMIALETYQHYLEKKK